MMRPNAAVVPREFLFLQRDLGFRVIENWESPYVHSSVAPHRPGMPAPQFGDATTTLASHNLLVRFIRDRGDIYVRLNRPPQDVEWTSLLLVRALVLYLDPGHDPTLAELAIFLHQHITAVAELYAETHIATTVASLQRLGRERVQAMFPGSVQEDTNAC